MKVALITGFPGQDAVYLADHLLRLGYHVIGGMKRYSTPNLSNLDFLGLQQNNNFRLEIVDVTDIGSIYEVVDKWRPEEIYNLAAQSFVGKSWKLTFATIQVNAIGPVNIIEVIKRIDPRIKFYQASTSEMFGNSSIEGLQTEETPFEPASPYGAAKLFAHNMVRNARDSFGIYACGGILFNHESPIRGEEFVTRKVTLGVSRIAKGLQDKMHLGNLDAERDWGHAKEYVVAQHRMLQLDSPNDYIIATGKKHSVRDLCRLAFEAVGISDWQSYVETSSEHVRPNDLKSLQASCERAQKELGWTAKVTFEELISEMVACDQERLVE